MVIFVSDSTIFNSINPWKCYDFFPMAWQPFVGQGLLISEASLSHSDKTNSVELLWTSDHPEADNVAWQHTALSRVRHPCRRRYSNPQSQQVSGRRATPLTARPLGSEYYDSPLLVARILSFRISNSIPTAHLFNARHVICTVEKWNKPPRNQFWKRGYVITLG